MDQHVYPHTVEASTLHYSTDMVHDLGLNPQSTAIEASTLHYTTDVVHDLGLNPQSTAIEASTLHYTTDVIQVINHICGVM
jgi:DNA-binding GntR family transcriptional regulator